jgi:hypothetical protein
MGRAWKTCLIVGMGRSLEESPALLVARFLLLLAGLILQPEDRSTMFLWNFDWPRHHTEQYYSKETLVFFYFSTFPFFRFSFLYIYLFSHVLIYCSCLRLISSIFVSFSFSPLSFFFIASNLESFNIQCSGNKIKSLCFCIWPPLWYGGQSSLLQIQRSRDRFPALRHFLSSGSGTGSTQPHEDTWGATWTEK